MNYLGNPDASHVTMKSSISTYPYPPLCIKSQHLFILGKSEIYP